MEKHPHCLGNLWKGEWWIAKGTWHRGASQTSCHWVWVSFSWEYLAGWAISGTGNHLGSLQMPPHNCTGWTVQMLGTASFLGEVPQNILIHPGLGYSLGVRHPAGIQDGYLIFWQDFTSKSLWPELVTSSSRPSLHPRRDHPGAVLGVTKEQGSREFWNQNYHQLCFPGVISCAEELIRILKMRPRFRGKTCFVLWWQNPKWEELTSISHTLHSVWAGRTPSQTRQITTGRDAET